MRIRKVSSWFLIPLVIFLAVINPSSTICVNNILQNAIGMLRNILPQRVIQYFINEVNKFQAKEYPDSTPWNYEEYDFIIVGAGSAGATIAARLSELEDQKILLIEAGDHENWASQIPIAALQFSNILEWGYATEPSQRYCFGHRNRQCRISCGKVMGGSSGTNTMIATRGNKLDYNEWAEMTGDNNWSYDSMLKYFKKLERFEVSNVEPNHEYHNYNGPVRIANVPHNNVLTKAFVKAGEDMGFSNVDYNGATQTGFSYLQTNQINGERLSSNRAYLHPIKGKRHNLSISMNSQVNKVLIEPATKTAYGVEFVKNNMLYRVRAKKEVILSAGAVGSPKILMLSGIGPVTHLQSHGIYTLADLPVGENLMDHIGYGGLVFFMNQTAGIVFRDFLSPNNSALFDYITKRQGPLSVAALEALSFFNVDDFTPRNNEPNMELMFSPFSMVSDYSVHQFFDISNEYFNQYYADKLHQHAYMIVPILLKPKSRGKVFLRSKNPNDKPIIHANYLSDPDDVRILIKGIRLAIEVSETAAMKQFGSHLQTRPVPGCRKYEIDSDAYWECALRVFTYTIYHVSGTCKMGHDNDASAVVNSRLQVRGINRLRVADASIMPTIISGHTNIPTIAIGERFADIIKFDYGYET